MKVTLFTSVLKNTAKYHNLIIKASQSSLNIKSNFSFL